MQDHQSNAKATKVLITGSKGFIGNYLISTLTDNYQIYCLDKLNGKDENITNYDSLLYHLSLFKPDVIVHLAADIEVGESETNPNKYYTDNLLGTLNVLRCIVELKYKPRLIFASTAAVYGQLESSDISQKVSNTFQLESSDIIQIKEGAYVENDAGSPVSVYGRTKLIAEEIIKDYAKIYNLSVVIFRFFNVAGGMDSHETQCHLIPIVLQRINEGKDINIFGEDYDTSDGTCVRDYIHVDDLCDAIKLIVDIDIKGFNVYNLGSGKGYSVNEVVQKCLEITKNPNNSLVKVTDRRPGDPAYLLADYSKAKNELGWEPKKSLTDIITDTWQNL